MFYGRPTLFFYSKKRPWENSQGTLRYCRDAMAA